uniref:Uncharacterized protein n=1 Tax=Pseudo-nitzschia australis TaxID=44445 RepID=A0A7S4EJI8_9STRA|mmetsp:Transcript_26397/g.57854  ORF Transcript_26397/g.57854 Transcript_26397/m.57854 type:complete len:128 (+) Transcript_26397:149-532(+)|eukprot:CAMPEP_0168192784 /NCGR_PEP_ID=MMETSP0139_2-20121125/18235_1 /TAXON_ID=44445 /ORGANISM="Pseudo-nitzschia australis, Strain 10249 10 AB" /LENGTH=127 /DNA_ID=CAMNT_0008116051 /DNA_START=97 /DNA_END=480 /DNA_ORIENTATION=+
MLNDSKNIGTYTNNHYNNNHVSKRTIVRIKRTTKFQTPGTIKAHINTNGALVGHTPATKTEENLSRTPSLCENEEDSRNFNDDDAQHNKRKRFKINQDDHVHTYKRVNIGAAESTFVPDYDLIVSWL